MCITQTITSPPMKCDWFQILTDNQIKPYDWLDLNLILLGKVEVSLLTSTSDVPLQYSNYYLASQTGRKERHSSCKMKLLFVVTFFLCISVGKSERNPYFFLRTNFTIAKVIDANKACVKCTRSALGARRVVVGLFLQFSFIT